VGEAPVTPVYPLDSSYLTFPGQIPGGQVPEDRCTWGDDSSDLHGAEEPIRWTLGWQRQDRVCDEPLHREEEGRPHQDVLAET
jgi:hypothetical protein